MKRPAIEAVLASSGWLAGRDPAFQRAVFDRARPISVPPDGYAFHAGDPVDGIYGVAQGAFAIAVTTDVAAPALATVVRSGKWFGNGRLAADSRRVLSFRATEASVALHLPASAIRDLIASGTEGARAFADLASLNMEVAIRVVSDLLIPQAERRIAATLLRVTRADEGEAPPDPAGFRLRQADLGEMANASRRSVVRALAAFEARGWVALGHRRIAVRDAAELSSFAQG